MGLFSAGGAWKNAQTGKWRPDNHALFPPSQDEPLGYILESNFRKWPGLRPTLGGAAGKGSMPLSPVSGRGTAGPAHFSGPKALPLPTVPASQGK